MHYLHAILVKLPDRASFNNAEDMAETARQIAIEATECHGDGEVWDWREEDAGCWANQYPRQGVVLGGTEECLFLKLLEKWRQRPLESALEELDIARQCAQLAFWPASPEELARRLWEGGQEKQQQAAGFLPLWDYLFVKSMRLAYGHYLSDSHFYSVPDDSPKISHGTLQETREHPNRFALVFLDFHN